MPFDSHRFQSRFHSDLKAPFMDRANSPGLINTQWRASTVERVIQALGISVCTFTLSACMTFTAEGFGPKTPDAQRGTDTVHGSLYGFFWSQPTAEKCDDSAQLFRVRFHTNIGYLSASIASLGFYVPQTIEWWCTDGQPADTPEEELYQPF